jgi:hypothetical protein
MMARVSFSGITELCDWPVLKSVWNSRISYLSPLPSIGGAAVAQNGYAVGTVVRGRQLNESLGSQDACIIRKGRPNGRLDDPRASRGVGQERCRVQVYATGTVVANGCNGRFVAEQPVRELNRIDAQFKKASSA